MEDHGASYRIEGLRVNDMPVLVYIDKGICPPLNDSPALQPWLTGLVRGIAFGERGRKCLQGALWPDRSRWVWIIREQRPDGSVRIAEAPSHGEPGLPIASGAW
ncbi:MAG: hypothetical protein ACM359_22820 [Bacillota bacterium]